MWLSEEHGDWLRDLSEWFDLAWATTWEHQAYLIAGVLSLPLDLTVIEFDHDREEATWKLHDVACFVGDQPFAWIDDDLWSDAFEWAEQRTAPTLLIREAPHRGLTRSHVQQLEEFGRRLQHDEER